MGNSGTIFITKNTSQRATIFSTRRLENKRYSANLGQRWHELVKCSLGNFIGTPCISSNFFRFRVIFGILSNFFNSDKFQQLFYFLLFIKKYIYISADHLCPNFHYIYIYTLINTNITFICA